MSLSEYKLNNENQKTDIGRIDSSSVTNVKKNLQLKFVLLNWFSVLEVKDISNCRSESMKIEIVCDNLRKDGLAQNLRKHIQQRERESKHAMQSIKQYLYFTRLLVYIGICSEFHGFRLVGKMMIFESILTTFDANFIF
jgi:hypothetical protein